MRSSDECEVRDETPIRYPRRHNVLPARNYVCICRRSPQLRHSGHVFSLPISQVRLMKRDCCFAKDPTGSVWFFLCLVRLAKHNMLRARLTGTCFQQFGHGLHSMQIDWKYVGNSQSQMAGGMFAIGINGSSLFAITCSRNSEPTAMCQH